MIKSADGARLLFKTTQSIRIGREIWRQDFDRHVASKPRVAGAIHFTHAACAEGRDNFVGAEACTGGNRHKKVNRV